MVRAPLLLLLVGASFFVVVVGSVDGAGECDADELVVGVDYYPEQWPIDRLESDLALIRSMGANMVRVGEFMWASIEPNATAADDPAPAFDFRLLDRIIDAAEAASLKVMLGTPTATMPSWLFRRHPEVLLKAPDSPEGYGGVVAGFGGRRQYSFNSEVYLAYAARVTAALGRRYGRRAAVTHWQVDNEYGHEGSDLDFSEASLRGFRAWLEGRYQGSIGLLNDAWGTTFWSARYEAFAAVGLPRWTVPGAPAAHASFRANVSPGMNLDFRRFRRDSITAFSNALVGALRPHLAPTAVVTHNAPGGMFAKALDYADVMLAYDVPAYDNYPVWGGSTEAPAASTVALSLDLARGWARDRSNGTFIVAEQLIGAQGHDIIGFLPRPNQAVAWSLAALAHGASGLLFFRFRPALFGQEEFCYGVLEHDGSQGRKFQEAVRVFGLAREHARLFATPVGASARVAVLYASDAALAWQATPQSTAFDFQVEVHRLYSAFWRQGLGGIDVLSASRLLLFLFDAPGAVLGDNSKTAVEAAARRLIEAYRVVVLPAPIIVPDPLVEVLAAFVGLGGSLWCSFRADLKDTNSWIRENGSRLAALAGVDVVEVESLNAPLATDLVRTETTAAAENKKDASTAHATVFREGLRPRDGTTEAIWRYTDPFFGGLDLAAVTRRRFASSTGEVVYVGTGIDPEALVPLALDTLQAQCVRHLGAVPDPDLERLLRVDAQGREWQININHADHAVGPLQPYDVQIHLANPPPPKKERIRP